LRNIKKEDNMDKLIKNMEKFFKNINKDELEQLLIKNGYNEIKPSSDFGYKLKLSSVEQYSNNYNFFEIIETTKYTTNEKIGEAA